MRYITFASPLFTQAASRLRRSAKRFAISVDVYNPESSSVRLAYAENPAIVGSLGSRISYSRGAGFWLWKPYIILDALQSGSDIVLYSDAGVTLINDPRPLLNLAKSRDVTLFRNRLADPQSKWCKRDAFVLLDADNPDEWNREQLDAAFIVCRNTEKAVAFIERWRDAMKDPRVLTDIPNTCAKPNLDGFVRHLNDQSVLTILAAKAEIVPLPSPSQPGLSDAPYPQIWYQHKRRNTHMLRQIWWWATGIYDGIWRVPKWAHPRLWGKKPG